MDYITYIDIFNRQNLIGDQSITTINNFNDYLESLLSPFNDKLTELLLEANNINVVPIINQNPFGCFNFLFLKRGIDIFRSGSCKCKRLISLRLRGSCRALLIILPEIIDDCANRSILSNAKPL